MNGKELSEIPDDFQGVFADRNDTLVFANPYIIFNQKDSVEMILSDTTVLKSYRGTFFLNSKNTDYEYWTVIALEFKKDRLQLYLHEVDEDDYKGLNRRFTVSETIRTNTGTVQAYLLSPSSKEWKKLLRSSYFPRKTLKRIE